MTNRSNFFVVTMVVAVLSLSTNAIGQNGELSSQAADSPGVPHLVQFSGVLKDASGTLPDNVASVAFDIYSEQTGGVPLWRETHNVQFSQGRYTVFLGEVTSGGIPTELFASGQPRWLGVRLLQPNEAEQPRVLLASVPYALKAVDADTLGGLPASAFVRAEPASTTPPTSAAPLSIPTSVGPTAPALSSVRLPPSTTVTTTGGTANTLPLFTGSSTIANSIITQSGTSSIAVNGGLSATGSLSALSINGALNAMDFAGADIGAQVNAAIAALPGLCGEVYIPAATYSQVTTIVKSRCVRLHGASAYGTILNYTPSTGWAIVAADGASGVYPEGAIEDLTLGGPGSSTTTGGIYVGGTDGSTGSPSASTDPSSNYGDHQNINRVRILGFGVGVQLGNHSWSDTIFESLISGDGTGMYLPSTVTNSGERIGIVGSSIQNNAGIGLKVSGVLGFDVYLVDSSLDYNTSWAVQNGTSTASSHVSIIGGHIEGNGSNSPVAGFIQNYGSMTLSGVDMYGGTSAPYLIDNHSNALTIIGGLITYTNGSGSLVNASGIGAIWIAPTTNVGINNPVGFFDRYGNFYATGTGTFSALPTNGMRFTPVTDTSGLNAVYGTNSINSSVTWSFDQVGNFATTGNITALGTVQIGSAPVPTVDSSPTAGRASCIKSVGPPVVIGYCSTAINSSGACTCN